MKISKGKPTRDKDPWHDPLTETDDRGQLRGGGSLLSPRNLGVAPEGCPQHTMIFQDGAQTKEVWGTFPSCVEPYIWEQETCPQLETALRAGPCREEETVLTPQSMGSPSSCFRRKGPWACLPEPTHIWPAGTPVCMLSSDPAHCEPWQWPVVTRRQAGLPLEWPSTCQVLRVSWLMEAFAKFNIS